MKTQVCTHVTWTGHIIYVYFSNIREATAILGLESEVSATGRNMIMGVMLKAS